MSNKKGERGSPVILLSWGPWWVIGTRVVSLIERESWTGYCFCVGFFLIHRVLPMLVLRWTPIFSVSFLKTDVTTHFRKSFSTIPSISTKNFFLVPFPCLFSETPVKTQHRASETRARNNVSGLQVVRSINLV